MQSTPATTKQPSRGLAQLLALIGPWGIGQFALGQTRRALLWFFVPLVVIAAGFLALPSLGGPSGYGLAFAGLCLACIGPWFASMVDLYRIPEERMVRSSAANVAAYWITGTVLSLIVRASFREFYLEAFKIPSGSMMPTLLIGDHIIADKHELSGRLPKRAEVIIFKFPENPEQDFVNRVIAVPGDTLEVKGGHPWINGWEVPHCILGKIDRRDDEVGLTTRYEALLEYLNGEAYLTLYAEGAYLPEGTQGPYSVAANEVWVLGDNRHNSHDSRAWFGGRGGGVPFDNVKARALFRWLTAAIEEGEGLLSRFGSAVATPLLPAWMKSLQPDLDRCLAQRPLRAQTVPPSSMR
jgi:signal peptidase I